MSLQFDSFNKRARYLTTSEPDGVHLTHRSGRLIQSAMAGQDADRSWQRFAATDLSEAALGARQFTIHGRHLLDGHGRVIQLHGVNVSSASKLPTRPDGLTPLTSEQFYQHKSVSFVGRPFPLDQAPLHFGRLRAWGLTCIRLLVTWESLAHAGPDPDRDLDTEYIDYLYQLIELMPQYGLKVFVCAHQDVWSRFSGGSGAPAWTFETAGLEIETFRTTGAAIISALPEEPETTKQRRGKNKEPVGAFAWPSGYQKLAAATMATLFWNGERVAWSHTLPSFNEKLTGSSTLNIQHYLQASYIECFGRLIDRLGTLEAVMGFDLMNEPHRGYIGMADWHRWCYETDLHIGHFPSILQSFALGSGYAQRVPFYVKSWPFPTRKTHMSLVDPGGVSAWSSKTGMGECIWQAHGAWQWDAQRKQAVVLSQTFFTHDPRPGHGGAPVEWYRDCYAPFLDRLSKRIMQRHPHLMMLMAPIPNEFFPPWVSPQRWSSMDQAERDNLTEQHLQQRYAVKTFIDTPRPANFVYAPHFYDLNVLFGKHHGFMSVDVQSLSRGGFLPNALFFGRKGLLKNYRRQIAKLVRMGQTSFGDVPTIIGEVGIPFDINGGQALRTGNYSKHHDLLDSLIDAMEQAQAGFTLWNYNPYNRADQGDGWNQEDFSLMCSEPAAFDRDNLATDGRQHGLDEEFCQLHIGGRALAAIIRPYAVKVAGRPVSKQWDQELGVFEIRYANDPGLLEASNKAAQSMSVEARTTKIFFPRYHFEGYRLRVRTSDGQASINMKQQTVSVLHDNQTPEYVHTVRIWIDGPLPDDQLTPEVRALLARRANIRRRQQQSQGGFTLLFAGAIGAVLLALQISFFLGYVTTS